jgi:hypothetical protein
VSFLRNVLHDLVEKRLWPVAVALLIALIAVPVVLGGSSSGADSGADDLAAAPAAPATARPASLTADQVVKLADAPAGNEPVERKGKVLNPFVQHHQPKPPKAEDTAGSVSNAANDLVSNLGNLGGPSPGGGSPVPVTSTPAPPATTPNADDKDTYRVSLKFGEDGAMKTYKNIARLTPLPSADNPFFIFLGISEDKKSAVFLVSSDAEPTGDGTCRPSNDDCAQVVMQKHDLEFFELQSGTAGVVQYQLEITGISKGEAKTTATAAKLRARESGAGRDYLRQVMAEDPDRLSGWDFSKKLGLLVEKESVSEDVANVPAAVARAASGEAPEGTATVMTVPVGADG